MGLTHEHIPAGGGFGKLWRIGKVGLPLNTQVQSFYNKHAEKFRDKDYIKFRDLIRKLKLRVD
jgi:hypothetical protein